MGRDFSPTIFFWHTPNNLLAQYFRKHHKDVLAELNIATVPDNQHSAGMITAAFHNLDSTHQAEIEATCQHIELMAHQVGIVSLIEVAGRERSTQNALTDALDKQSNMHGKAMWLFLNVEEKYWHEVSSLLHADNIADTSWHRRNDLPANLSFKVTPNTISAFENTLSGYFRDKEGRGRHCKVHHYQRTTREYVFAYLSDFGQADTIWNRGKLATRNKVPVFEIIFVYSAQEHSLDIHAPKNTKYIPHLQQAFSKQILATSLPQDSWKDNRVYVLTKLAKRDFPFEWPDNSEIKSVSITAFYLSVVGKPKRKIVLRANEKNNKSAIYDLMDSTALPPFHITTAEISVMFHTPVPGTKQYARSFRISSTKWCNLKHNPRDNMIREMLKKSELEPTTPMMNTEDTV
ncbi:MAG: hypothetical protein GY782_02315 [Gammaproteobacteria bacterium]|nr:hypothetical protein [Gammaproteobacteria bacterium]